jgi:hypothetical protein
MKGKKGYTRLEWGYQQANEIRRLQIRTGINATAQAYENAHYFPKLREPVKAIRRLQDAGSTAPLLFIEPDLFLLTRVIEIATWSSWKKFPEYEPLVFKYLAAESGKRLGQQHPLTHLLACFEQAAAISTSYPTLWSCIIDHIDQLADDQVSRGESQQIRIKAYFYLLRVLRNNRDYFAAVERCKELIQLCIAVDGMRLFSANRAISQSIIAKQAIWMMLYEETEKYLERSTPRTMAGFLQSSQPVSVLNSTSRREISRRPASATKMLWCAFSSTEEMTVRVPY